MGIFGWLAGEGEERKDQSAGKPKSTAGPPKPASVGNKVAMPPDGPSKNVFAARPRQSGAVQQPATSNSASWPPTPTRTREMMQRGAATTIPITLGLEERQGEPEPTESAIPKANLVQQSSDKQETDDTREVETVRPIIDMPGPKAKQPSQTARIVLPKGLPLGQNSPKLNPGDFVTARPPKALALPPREQPDRRAVTQPIMPTDEAALKRAPDSFKPVGKPDRAEAKTPESGKEESPLAKTPESGKEEPPAAKTPEPAESDTATPDAPQPAPNSMSPTQSLNPQVDRVTYVRVALVRHFSGARLSELTSTSRRYPAFARIDLYKEIAGFLDQEADDLQQLGIHQRESVQQLSFAGLQDQENKSPIIAPLQIESIDTGTGYRECPRNSLWLGKHHSTSFAVLLAPAGLDIASRDWLLEVTVSTGEAGTKFTESLLGYLDSKLDGLAGYRGQILSLSVDPHGTTTLRTLDLPVVKRDDLVLPDALLSLLDRNVLDFARQRERLAKLGMPTRKGILFYGAPGTGKTYSLRYISSELPDHTILIVAPEHMHRLREYMDLARRLQPSILVIEDVDIIGRSRQDAHDARQETQMNILMQEMDSVRDDAQIMFILTTNRPQMLESALASRPGRIDQAIEYPLPGYDSRIALVHLFSRGVKLAPHLVSDIADRTDGATPAFMKELLRRAIQWAVGLKDHAQQTGEETEGPAIEDKGQANEGDGDEILLTIEHVERAIEEILLTGGSLNAALLSGELPK